MPRRSASDAALTRAALVDAARACFVADGYASTTTAAIAARAGCSQSALFHHFADKSALFEIVIAAEVQAYDEQVGHAARAATGGPLARVLAGCRRSLELAAEPSWSQLVGVDALAVLGPERFHRVDADLGLKSTTFAVTALIGSGILAEDTDVEALALVLYGALTSAALELARVRAGGDSPEPSTDPGEHGAPSNDASRRGPPSIDRVMAVIERLILAYGM